MATKFYKHPKFGHCYGLALPTPVGRCCWPSLVKPKDPPPPQPGKEPGQPRYELNLLLDKTDPVVVKFAELVKGMTDEMLEQFNEKKPTKLSCTQVFVDGDTFDMEKYPFYRGMWVLTARNSSQPQVVDSGIGKKPAMIDHAAIIGGMKCRMVITPMITTSGISYKLAVAQLVEDDGVRFGGGTRDMISFLDALGGDAEEVVAPTTATEVVKAEYVPEPPAPAAETPRGAGKKAALDLL